MGKVGTPVVPVMQVEIGKRITDQTNPRKNPRPYLKNN
jgi:hypothetical protein